MAKSKSPYQSPTAKLQPTPAIHQHVPGKSIAQAISHANQHVANVNAAAKK
jgi:hypothetical protein